MTANLLESLCLAILCPSVLSDASGRVLARSALERAAVLQVRLPRRIGLTPFMRVGDAPGLAAAGMLLVAGWYLAMHRRNHAPGDVTDVAVG